MVLVRRQPPDVFPEQTGMLGTNRFAAKRLRRMAGKDGYGEAVCFFVPFPAPLSGFYIGGYPCGHTRRIFQKGDRT